MSESTASVTGDRTFSGTEFPSAGTWNLDPAHTAVEFQAKHLMVAKVRGRFAGTVGALHIAEDPTRSSAEVRIVAGSLDTGVQQRDDHLRSPDFLEAGKYPEITFRSTSFEHVEDEEWHLHGDLTIHGVTKPVTLKTEYNGQTTDPWGLSRAFFSAETKIDREHWGLTWNQALESGGWLVGKEIKISIEVEAVLQQD